MRFLLIVLLFLISCNYLPTKRKSKENTFQKLLPLIFIMPPSVGDAYSQIFYVNPLFFSSKNYNFIERISGVLSSEKKQVLLIHGFQPKDTDSVPFPTEQDLKLRLLDDIWKEALEVKFFESLVSKGYDLYLYTYLTSNNISANGTRLVSLLEKHFLNLSNFYIFAHSMGGLVIRDAIYKSNNSNLSMKEIYTIGSPFHGSPWASSQFQESRTVLGEYASVITKHSGGQDLAWDNYNNSLIGSSNSYLAEMNSKTHKDFLITAVYSSMDKNASGYMGLQSWLNAGCLSLGDTFSPSDCIVPSNSASGEGLNFKSRYNLGNYNHFDIKFGVANIRNYFFNLLP